MPTTPSITTWSCVEVRPRAPWITQSLQARVRDPVFMLTRQWQMAEFRGEDTGSPAFVQVSAQLAPLIGVRLGADPEKPLPDGVPLERVVGAEAFGAADLSLRVELGQTFERLLRAANLGRLAGAFRAAYFVDAVADADLAAEEDQEAARFRRVCGGRALDGFALHVGIGAPPRLPPQPPIAAADQPAVLAVLEDFERWIAEVLGEWADPAGEPPAWDAERLEYRAAVVAEAPGGGTAVLAADPGDDGELDWYAFDLAPAATSGLSVVPRAVQSVLRSVVPSHVRFRGMPNARWWDFERNTTDFGDIKPDTRDLARIVVVDFMLVHGNDWFVASFAQPVGTLCSIDALVVQDVFGGLTLIERADAALGAPGHRWTMFSTSVRGDPARVADFFVLSPSVASVALDGPALEDVRFLRDEAADMAWAVEHTTENGVGRPWRGHERDLAGRAPAPSPGGALSYALQTLVPVNWIPFVPVRVDPQSAEVALERATMLITDATRPGGPAGRIVQATSRLREEQLSRAGARVLRVPRYSRWTDGSTYVWIAPRHAAGEGEGQSGLRFDLAERGK